MYVVFTPGNAITPSRNSSLVSQTQFVFLGGRRKFSSDLEAKWSGSLKRLEIVSLLSGGHRAAAAGF